MRCIPCEAKAEMNRRKMGFLMEQGAIRASEQNQDYVIYEDYDDAIYKLATFDEAQRRGEKIVLHISRFERTNVG